MHFCAWRMPGGTPHPSSLPRPLSVVAAAAAAAARPAQMGTPLYAAPEVLRQERYGAKVDVWSLGCVMEVMCSP